MHLFTIKPCPNFFYKLILQNNCNERPKYFCDYEQYPNVINNFCNKQNNSLVVISSTEHFLLINNNK